MAKSPAEEALNTVVRDAVTAVLKPIGFKKSANTFHRRLGSCVQVVNIQGSMGSSWMEKTFYVNVGLAFDEICRHTNRSIMEKPKEHECDARGMRARLEQLVTNSPAQWEVSATSDASAISQSLRPMIEQMVLVLNQIDGLVGFRDSPWFQWHPALAVPAQVHYLLGNKQAARANVVRLTEYFADRRVLSERDHWIEKLKLESLDE